MGVDPEGPEGQRGMQRDAGEAGAGKASRQLGLRKPRRLTG